jgi:glycosyltransferase involved in cell wall biosynthesis
MRALDHSIAVSKATAIAWARRCWFSKRKSEQSISVIHNGVDVTSLQRVLSSPEAKSKHGWDNRLVIGSVGRLEAAKGYEYLLRALPEIFESYPEVVVKIAGSGELLEPLRHLAKELGVGDRVDFLGFTLRVREFLETVDIYVQPSLCEALGFAILEASAVGVPVIASDVGGPAECVVDNETGFLVPSRDPDALREALSTLISDEAKRVRMASAGSRLVREKFRDDQMVNATLSVYRKLLTPG